MSLKFITDPVPEFSYEEELGYKTLISQFENNAEQRRNKWSQGRKIFTLKYNIKAREEIDRPWNFYQLCRGSYKEFNFQKPFFLLPYDQVTAWLPLHEGEGTKADDWNGFIYPAFSCRFLEDRLSYEEFSVMIQRTGIRLIQVSPIIYTNNYGTITGAAWAECPDGSACVDFDGSDDQISIGNVAALNVGTGDFSFAFAIYADSLVAQLGVLSKKASDLAAAAGYHVVIDTNGQITVRLADGTNQNIIQSSVGAIPLQAWKIVIVTIGREVKKDQTGSTFNCGDFTATNAFFWSSLNLSAYAGTDAGYTPFYIEVLDGAGKKATGYIGAVGAGETLGSELLTNGTFQTDLSSWSLTLDGGTIVWDAGTLKINCAGNFMYASQQGSSSAQGQLMKLVSTITAITGLYAMMKLGTAQNSHDIYHSGYKSVAATYTYYKTVPGATTWITLGEGDGSPQTSNWDNISFRRITDPPATAVHIVSSLNGTTRDWASIESGFDPDNIVSWKIKAAASDGRVGQIYINNVASGGPVTINADGNSNNAQNFYLGRAEGVAYGNFKMRNFLFGKKVWTQAERDKIWNTWKGILGI